ncbi:MAG: iron ABC transporter permease, partial [Flavisolibacter sp.]|nr:iron ABC transporter permease [Flavisolibacter sp.]
GMVRSIFNSITIALFVSLFSVAIGSCFAFLLAKSDLPKKKLFKTFLLLPLLLPSYILAVAWTDVWLYVGLPKSFIYSLPAVIFILTTVYAPLVTFIIAGSLANVAASLEEAGEMMADYKTVFLKIVLPLIRPALLSSFLLIFILSASEFAVPAYLSVNVFATQIFTEFAAFYNYGAATAQALVLTFICLLLLFPERFYLSKAPFLSFGKRAFHQKTISLENKQKWLLLCIMYVFVFVILPLLLLLVQAMETNRIGSIIRQLMPALSDTLLLSLAGAFLITFFGFVLALISNRYKTKAPDYVLLFVFAVPAIVIGLALTQFYNTPALNWVYRSFVIVLIAFIVRFVFIAQKIIANALVQIPDSFTEAAKVIGASSAYAFRKITLPLLGEALYTSFFVSLIFCVAELATVIMVYPPGISLLPVRIFTLMANAPQSTVSAMCVVALLFSLSLIAALAITKKILLNQQWRTSQL